MQIKKEIAEKTMKEILKKKNNSTGFEPRRHTVQGMSVENMYLFKKQELANLSLKEAREKKKMAEIKEQQEE